MPITASDSVTSFNAISLELTVTDRETVTELLKYEDLEARQDFATAALKGRGLAVS